MSIKSHLVQIALAGAVAYTVFDIMPNVTVYKEKIQANTMPTPKVTELKKPSVDKKQEIQTSTMKSNIARVEIPEKKDPYDDYPKIIRSDADMFRQNVFHLDEIYHCFYDDKTGTWDMKPESGWTVYGNYDLSGKTKGKVTSVTIKYYQQGNAILDRKCTVWPEWGNSYIDEDCKKKYIAMFKEDLYNIVYKRKFEGKNIYQICANTCGGGIGYCNP